MKRWAVAFLLGFPVAADETPDHEDALFRQWEDATPHERLRLRAEMERLDRGRRFSRARPVLVEFDGGALTLAEVFHELLEPALFTPTAPASERDPGLQEIHRDALSVFAGLREAYAPPQPVTTGTLNLFLGYAHTALNESTLPAAVRLRFFLEAVKTVRGFEGRVEPDARTGWLVRSRLVPALRALARRATDDAVNEAVSEVASMLQIPSILDARSRAQLAPLASGAHSRDVLRRLYSEGRLDDLGRVALARSVAAQARDDPAFAAGAPPLMLELLCDPAMPGRERAQLAGVVFDRLAEVGPLRDTSRDLLAAVFGGPPRPVAEHPRDRKSIAVPRGDRTFRFLGVVLLASRADAPPAVVRVVRRDKKLHEPLHAGEGVGRRFLGVLLPAAGGAHADFVGPPPGLSSRHDNRLLRRRLRLERVEVNTFGPRGEEIEISTTLPEDGSEPVPVKNPSLNHVVDLIDGRLKISGDDEERAELVALLVRFGTERARAGAVRHATTPAAIAALLPLAERGHRAAAARVLGLVARLAPAVRERALAAALEAGLGDDVRALCRHDDPAVAILAADALFGRRDPTGIEALLKHVDKYARASAGGLALRLTPHAGSLRVVAEPAADLGRLATLVRDAFSKEDGPSFVKLGAWLHDALTKPTHVLRDQRTNHADLFLGKRRVSPSEFADAYAAGIREGKAKKLWGPLMVFLLDANDPGVGIPRRSLDPLLDALAERAEGALRTEWTDALVCLVCAQAGIDLHREFFDLAHERLRALAGEAAPARARLKAAVYWPLWAAKQ